MDSNVYAELAPAVSSAGRIVADRWPGVIDADDVAQELWVRLMERPNSVAKLLTMKPSSLRQSLVDMGHQTASEYRSSYELFSGQVHYGTEDVRRILERGALTEEKTRTDTERMDLFEGLEMLQAKNERYARIVFLVFALRESVDDTKSITRAVDSLTDCMNRVHNSARYSYEDGPGSRKVVSNAAARAKSSGHYEEWDKNGE